MMFVSGRFLLNISGGRVYAAENYNVIGKVIRYLGMHVLHFKLEFAIESLSSKYWLTSVLWLGIFGLNGDKVNTQQL